MMMYGGRQDQQVKVRGHRIELLALEAALNAHPDVRDAVALTVANGPVGPALIAFLVPRRRPIDSSDIREFLSERLLPYYQPDRIEWLEEIPRTPNGKSDRAELLTRAHAMV